MRKTGKADARQYFFDLNVLNGALLQLNASDIISQAFLNLTSAKNFEFYPSIVGRQKIGEFGFGGSILQEQTCNWNSSDVSLDGKEVEACPMSIMVEICQWDVERSFIANQLALGKSFTEPVPADLQAVVTQKIKEKLQEELELITWKGDDDLDSNVYGHLALCDGLEKKINTNVNEGEIPASQILASTTVTSSNVIDTLTSAYNAIPTKLKTNKADLKMFVSQNIADAYLIATATQSNEIYFLADRPLNFLGIEMVVAGGASDNTLVISRKINYALLTDMLSFEPSFNIVNMTATTNEPKMRFRSDLKFGVDTLNDNEFVVMMDNLKPTLSAISPTSGAVGAVVTLTGTNLGATTKVMFGTIEGTDVTVVNGTTVTAKVPTGATGTVAVKAVTPAGETGTKNFTVS